MTDDEAGQLKAGDVVRVVGARPGRPSQRALVVAAGAKAGQVRIRRAPALWTPGCDYVRTVSRVYSFEILRLEESA